MTVCIAEKPSVAAEIAKVLGARSKKDGYYEGNGYQVTWTFGHLCQLKQPDGYYADWKKWDMNILPMIPPRYELEVIPDAGVRKQFKVIKELYKKADVIVNCGDAGQEGELIQRWVMELAGVKCPVKRLWISSLTEESIRHGFRDLKPQSQYDSLYAAGQARAEGDWLLGMNATRLYTLKYGGYKQVLSIGRVQTPTLAYRDGEGVSLKKIEHAIAYLIKHKFGWNDDLGKYDADVPYQTRAENSVERIGKKYQWIGMYRVYAYLCDTCQMKTNIWTSFENFAEKNYPWYAREHDYYDPTLTTRDLALEYTHLLFEVIHPVSTMNMAAKEWLNDARQMPPLYFMVKDRNEREWVVLQAYSIIKEENEDEKREQFVFYNGLFTERDDYEKLRVWATETNFYGRWMPEHRGSIDYHWNEYPWADSYKQLVDDEDETFHEGGCEMKLAYELQLQEDYKGMKDEHHFLTTVYMPCRDMMELFGWHTAERGVIRDAQENIVAINREIPGEPLHALLVLRSKLDAYLEAKNKVLFWCLIGEKQP